MKDSKKEDFLDDDFNEIDARLTAGWYVNSGQRKRYLKSLNQIEIIKKFTLFALLMLGFFHA